MIQEDIFSFLNLEYENNISDFSYSFLLNNCFSLTYSNIFLSSIFLKFFLNLSTYVFIDFFTDQTYEPSLAMYSNFWKNNHNNPKYLMFTEKNKDLKFKYKMQDINYLRNKKEKYSFNKNNLYFSLCFTNIELLISIVPLFLFLSLFNFFWIFSLIIYIIILISTIFVQLIVLYGFYEFLSEKYYRLGHEFFEILESNKKEILKSSFLDSCK